MRTENIGESGVKNHNHNHYVMVKFAVWLYAYTSEHILYQCDIFS